MERARDLFEQCLDGCPAEYCKAIYLLYAKLEETHGMARHAMSVYERAAEAVPKLDKFAIFNIYLRKAAEIYGVTRTRQIYEKVCLSHRCFSITGLEKVLLFQAIESLEDAEARSMCLDFAEMETKLGEVDRARAIYGHCSQMCDPRVAEQFWAKWKVRWITSE